METPRWKPAAPRWSARTGTRPSRATIASRALGHDGRTVAAGGESLFADSRAIGGSRPRDPGHASMRLRPNVALQQTGRLLMERAPRALLSIALQLNLGVRRSHTPTC